MFDKAMKKVASAVSSHGLHKLSAHVMQQDGVTPPKNWTDEEVGRSLGTKVAFDLLTRKLVAEGLVSLSKVSR